MAVTIRPTGPATARPPSTEGTTIPGVIGGTGDLGDQSDATYVEVIREVVGHFSGSGQDQFNGTNGYYVDFPPAEDLGPFPTTDLVEGLAVLTGRARIKIVAYDIEYFDVASLGFGLERESDGLTLTGIGQPPIDATTPVGVAQWMTFSSFVSENDWEALRTGVYPGYGAVRFNVGWQSTPGFTPPNDVGDETRIRVYEVEFTYGAADAVAEIRVTRQFPRDDEYGLGSAPRIFPPPRRGRVVGGYQ